MQNEFDAAIAKCQAFVDSCQEDHHMVAEAMAHAFALGKTYPEMVTVIGTMLTAFAIISEEVYEICGHRALIDTVGEANMQLIQIALEDVDDDPEEDPDGDPDTDLPEGPYDKNPHIH